MCSQLRILGRSRTNDRSDSRWRPYPMGANGNKGQTDMVTKRGLYHLRHVRIRQRRKRMALQDAQRMEQAIWREALSACLRSPWASDYWPSSFTPLQAGIQDGYDLP